MYRCGQLSFGRVSLLFRAGTVDVSSARGGRSIMSSSSALW